MDKKLKIAVFHNLPSGGAIKALQDNCSYIKNQGHFIDVYFPDTANESFAPLNDIVDNYYKYPVKKSSFRNMFCNLMNFLPKINISKNSKFRISFNDFKNTQKKIAEDINQKDYDIVFSEQDGLFTMTPAFLKYVEKPLVYYCQQPFRSDEMILKKIGDNNHLSLSDKLFNRFSRKYVDMDKEYAQYCENILVNSYFSHENLLRIYGMNSQVSYLGIDTNSFKPIKTERKNFIISVGSIMPHKGFDFIIKSVGKIDESIRPQLKIVGYASNKSWLNHLIGLAENNNVDLEILQNVSYEELVQLYNEAKLFLFGSVLEPFGLVSLEAMACGTPTIAVKEGGIREIVKHMENGLLLDRDEDVFADGITELLTNDELWNKFSENGPDYVRDNWSLDIGGKNLLNHFYRVLNKK